MFTNEQMEQLRLLLSNLATKGDLGLLKDDMKFMENSLRDDMKLMEDHLKDDMKFMENRLKDDIKFVEGSLKDDMKFMENSLVTKINKVTTMLEGDFFNESKRVNTLTHRVSDLNKRVEHLEQK